MGEAYLKLVLPFLWLLAATVDDSLSGCTKEFQDRWQDDT